MELYHSSINKVAYLTSPYMRYYARIYAQTIDEASCIDNLQSSSSILTWQLVPSIEHCLTVLNYVCSRKTWYIWPGSVRP